MEISFHFTPHLVDIGAEQKSMLDCLVFVAVYTRRGSRDMPLLELMTAGKVVMSEPLECDLHLSRRLARPKLLPDFGIIRYN
jgi:hypothetical protein